MKESVFKCTLKGRNVSKKFDRNPVSWWDIDCDKYIRLRKSAFKNWQCHPNILKLINYKEQVAVTKKLLKNKKRDSFKKFAAGVSCRTSLTYF